MTKGKASGGDQLPLMNGDASKIPKLLVPGLGTDINGFALNEDDKCPWVYPEGYEKRECSGTQSVAHRHW